MESPGHGAGEGGSTRGAISAQRAGRIMGDTGPESAFVHRGALPSHRALSRAGGVVVTQGAHRKADGAGVCVAPPGCVFGRSGPVPGPECTLFRC